MPSLGIGRPGAGNSLNVAFMRARACLVAALALAWLASAAAYAENAPWSERIANVLLEPQAASQLPGESASWNAGTGLELEGLEAEWYNTAQGDYYQRAKEIVDAMMGANPETGFANQPVRTIGPLGRQLLLFYRITLDEKYYRAAERLRNQLSAACGISAAEGHAIQPGNQDSTQVCTAEPFLSEFAFVFDKPGDFSAIAKDFLLWDTHLKVSEPRVKLPGTDAMSSDAALAAALVDSLGYFPPGDPGAAQLGAILNRIASTTEGRFQTGGKTEISETPIKICLYVYALLKGTRLGYLPQQFSSVGERVWSTLLENSIHVDANGAIRISESRGREQKPKATAGSLGAFLLAATEVDLAPIAADARGQTVTVDSWYNSQRRKTAAGTMEYFHYKWSDISDSGYSLLGHMFQSHGASLGALTSAPTRDNLRGSQFYVIVSPDIPVKNPNPHYMADRDASEIAAWVHDGGVLILMENDPPNADITHLNLLADRFGIHFDDVLKHHIIGEQVEDGRISVEAGGPLFHQSHTLYMKDTCAISVRGPATALLRDRGDIVMAAAKYGQGMVFATVDPWLYNEYTDGRKNSHIYGQFDNFAAGQEVVRWLLDQRPDRQSGAGKKAEK